MKAGKRQIALLLAILFCFAGMPLCAGAAGTDITGPETLAPGDTVTIEFSVTECADARSVEGDILFDPNQLALQEVIPDLTDPWVFDHNEGGGRLRFLGYDSSMEAPINGYQKLFTLTFRVQEGLSDGEQVQIEASNVLLSDGESDVEAVLTSYTVSVGESDGTQVPMISEGNASSKQGISSQEAPEEDTESLEKATKEKNKSIPLPFLLLGAAGIAVVVVIISVLLAKGKHKEEKR